MLEKFLDYLRRQELLPPGSRALLAVSGGLDSVVMAQLFQAAALTFGIAHVNFQLRGAEAAEDERFVAELAARLGAPFYSTAFDTENIAREAGLSIQLTARQLRYDWLEHIRSENAYTHIATAHHLNDSIETLLYNLAKGCGIRGLHGIPARNGSIIRPLLFAERTELEAWARKESLLWREDASNAETKYHRNLIRHQVIPALKDINPGLENTMAANIERLRQTEYLFDWAIARIRSEALKEEDGRIILDTNKLNTHTSALESLLYELLSPFGFNASQAAQLAQRLEHSGAVYYTPTHRLLVDRERLLIEPLPSGQETRAAYAITEDAVMLALPEGSLALERRTGRPASWPVHESEAVLDAAALAFPLRLRRWQPGDAFQPLGMGGKRQKVQDYFTNNKVPRFDKEQAWVLEDAQGRICWLVGHRIDHRFRIGADTPAHWVLRYEKNAALLG